MEDSLQVGEDFKGILDQTLARSTHPGKAYCLMKFEFKAYATELGLMEAWVYFTPEEQRF